MNMNIMYTLHCDLVLHFCDTNNFVLMVLNAEICILLFDEFSDQYAINGRYSGGYIKDYTFS